MSNDIQKKNLITNISSSILVKGASIIVSFLATPAYISYFNGSPLLGIWLALVAMLTWIINFDLGIGNGLRNKIVSFLLKKDYKKIKEYISSAYIMLCIISLFFLIVGVIAISIINWNKVFNISNDVIQNDDLKKVVITSFFGVLLYFVLKIITSILLAMEKVAIVNFLQLSTNFLNLIYILIIKEDNPKVALIKLAYFYIFSLNIPYIIATVLLFFTSLKKCRPDVKYWNKRVATQISTLGGKFFFIQVMLMIINSTNELIITNIYGPQYVVEYQIYYKIFYLVVTMLSLITNPIWSNVSVAYSMKNFDWIRKIRLQLKKVSYIASIGLVLLVFMFPKLSEIWLGEKNIIYNYKIGMLFAFYCIIMIKVLSETAIANGINLLKMQMIFFTIGAVLRIPIVIICSIANIQWESVVIANIIVLLPFVIAQERDIQKNLINWRENHDTI